MHLVESECPLLLPFRMMMDSTFLARSEEHFAASLCEGSSTTQPHSRPPLYLRARMFLFLLHRLLTKDAASAPLALFRQACTATDGYLDVTCIMLYAASLDHCLYCVLGGSSLYRLMSDRMGRLSTRRCFCTLFT